MKGIFIQITIFLFYLRLSAFIRGYFFRLYTHLSLSVVNLFFLLRSNFC